jgi:hypothetical protein
MLSVFKEFQFYTNKNMPVGELIFPTHSNNTIYAQSKIPVEIY